MRYFSDAEVDGNDWYQDYPNDFVTIIYQRVDPYIQFGPSTEAIKWQIGTWPTASAERIIKRYADGFAKGEQSQAKGIAYAQEQRRQEAAKRAADARYMEQAVREGIQENKAFYDSLDKSTNQMMDNINNMIANQPRKESAPDTGGAVRQGLSQASGAGYGGPDLSARREAVCKKIGRTSEFKDGRWQCVSPEIVVNVPLEVNPLCYDPAGKACETGESMNKVVGRNGGAAAGGGGGAGGGAGAVSSTNALASVGVSGSGAGYANTQSQSGTAGEGKNSAYDTRYEAIAYCFKNEHNRWLCDSTHAKTTLSEETLEKAEKNGVCAYRDKRSTVNGYIYFCDRPLESYDRDVYEIYKLYSDGPLRKKYSCPSGGMTIQCETVS